MAQLTSGRPDSVDQFRLAAVTSHPVQYQAPLFQRLAGHPSIDLTVYYGHDASVTGELDPEFGLPIAWDRPLLAGYRSVVLATCDQRLRWWRRMSRQAAVIRHIWRGRYDAVFIHSYATWLSLMAYAGAWLSRTPVLVRTESHDIWARPAPTAALKSIVLRVLFRHTDAFLSIGEANQRFYERLGVGSDRLFWTPYGVDNEFFSSERERLLPERDAIRRELGIAPDEAVVVYSGKLIERKRVEDLLLAASRVGAKMAVLIIGDGPCRSRLLEATVRLGVKVLFVGFQNQTQLARYYVCGDVFVLPSRHETWGLVLNEAMLFEMPVIATTAVGAGVDLIEPHVTGFSYRSGDITRLAEYLELLAADPDRRHVMGRAARRLVGRYTYDACVEGITSALTAIAERRWDRARREQPVA
jgi:glycosyltransferase involved in cell wall biosynthesis